VERFHQTLKRYLSKQTPATSLTVLQAQLDTFRGYYNQQRPHRALDGATLLTAFNTRRGQARAAVVSAADRILAAEQIPG
jgi:transposase InsO family protein